MAKTTTKTSGRMRLYRSYNFVDKDPGIDKMRTIVQDELGRGKGVAQKLSTLSNVGASTIDNWFNGKTRRPQHTTMAAAMAALGYQWTLVQEKPITDYEAELKKAARWHEAQAKK
jgi:transcriptional regulator with XRE-family HTH domain